MTQIPAQILLQIIGLAVFSIIILTAVIIMIFHRMGWLKMGNGSDHDNDFGTIAPSFSIEKCPDENCRNALIETIKEVNVRKAKNLERLVKLEDNQKNFMDTLRKHSDKLDQMMSDIGFIKGYLQKNGLSSRRK